MNDPNRHLGQRKPTLRLTAPFSDAMAPPIFTAIRASLSDISKTPPCR